MKVARFLICLILSLSDAIPTVDNILRYPFDSERGYVIVPVDRLGLANRLRIIASAFTIASLESKHLLILWKPSIECNVQFHSVFQPLIGSSSTSIDVLPLDENLELDTMNLNSIFMELSTRVPHEIVIRYPNQFFFNISSSIALQRIFVLRLMTSHALWSTSCVEYMRYKTEFYHLLHPVSSIQRQIDVILQLIESGLSDSRFTSPPIIVGVHYRAYDQRYDWPTLPPHYLNLNQSSTMSQALVFEESTPLSTVVEILLSLHRSNPNIIFYFASNDLHAIQYLREFSHSASFTSFDSGLLDSTSPLPHRFSSRSSDESMTQAVIDFMILGTISNLLLHSRGSSFAQEAAYLSHKNIFNSHSYPIPVLDLMTMRTDLESPQNWEVKSQSQQRPSRSIMILTHFVELEHCGLSEYFHSMEMTEGGTEKQYCFYEMTGEEYDSFVASASNGEGWNGNGKDGRTVCTISQTLRRCSEFEKKWKIHGVYCPLSTTSSSPLSSPADEGEERITIYAEINGL
jgi:hypothetical protein